MSLPERLGRLRRVERIGVGGFATVWLYRDDQLDSNVAVKALADNWAVRDDVRERFLEEARILRRADSDHVVRVYDIGEEDGTPYFVMSYADRGSMSMLLDSGRPLPSDQVADLIEQAAAGVSVLHRHGVIHRDLKPQNLLLKSSPGGGTRVLVADLGVAKAMLHASGLTQVVGTPAYMAPEQALGYGLDERADIHALGAVAYHLLTARLVRQGGLAGVGAAKLPPAPSTIVGVSPVWDDALLKALAPTPDRRWPDVASFVAAVRRAAAAPPPMPPPPPVPARLRPTSLSPRGGSPRTSPEPVPRASPEPRRQTSPRTSPEPGARTSPEPGARTSPEPRRQTSPEPRRQTSPEPRPQTPPEPRRQTSPEPRPQTPPEPRPDPRREPTQADHLLPRLGHVERTHPSVVEERRSVLLPTLLFLVVLAIAFAGAYALTLMLEL